MIIGSRLRKERLDRNITQKQLADMIGVSKASISSYEKNQRTPTLDVFEKMIDVLNMDPSYLLGRELGVVSEIDTDYGVSLSKDDIVLLKELKANSDLYLKLVSDPKRTIIRISKKLK